MEGVYDLHKKEDDKKVIYFSHSGFGCLCLFLPVGRRGINSAPPKKSRESRLANRYIYYCKANIKFERKHASYI